MCIRDRREHGPAIRGIATSGRFGATRDLIEALPALEGIFLSLIHI